MSKWVHVFIYNFSVYTFIMYFSLFTVYLPGIMHVFSIVQYIIFEQYFTFLQFVRHRMYIFCCWVNATYICSARAFYISESQ